MAVETLRPNDPGDECNITSEAGADCPNHYQNVDEEIADEDSTYVVYSGSGWLRDLYNIDNSSGSGTINSITVFARGRITYVGETDQNSLKIAIKSGVTASEAEKWVDNDSYENFSNQWTTNPDDDEAWEWSDIDALQIGVALRRYASTHGWGTRCTQVYVEVDYTPVVGWTGKISGVTNPAKIMGVDVANIAKVKGVE